MTTAVTKEDLSTLASVGVPVPARPKEQPERTALADAVLHVLSAPSARLVSAAALAVLELAKSDQLDLFDDDALDDDVRRRLGYLVEQAARETQLDEHVRTGLEMLGERLHRSSDSE